MVIIMKRKIVAGMVVLMCMMVVVVLGIIIPAMADTGMLTYTNEEYGFSIQYPGEWTVEEGWMGSIVYFGDERNEDFITNVLIKRVELQTKMTVEEFAEGSRKLLPEDYNVVNTFQRIINGEPVAGHILTRFDEGTELKQMGAFFIRDEWVLVIVFTATSSTYNGVEEDYFNPMLESFKFIEKEVGIGIRHLTVTPHKLESGEEVSVKLDIVNEADVEKTKTFHLVTFHLVGPSEFSEFYERDFETVTLAPGEMKTIKVTFIPIKVGTHLLSVNEHVKSIDVTEARPKDVEDIPGFEAIFAIIGLVAVTYLIIIKNNRGKRR